MNSSFQTMEKTRNIYIYIIEHIFNVQPTFKSLICN